MTDRIDRNVASGKELKGVNLGGPVSGPVSSVPMLDVGRGNGPLKQEFMAAIERVIDSGRFCMGPRWVN